MIKDNMQPQSISGYKLPKLKGTVEIKLHNPTTGKTEIQRGENMITNAVSDIFASNYCGALDYRKLLPLYNKMYGGILCFSKQLNVDTEQGAADDYFIPDNHPTNGNPVTAHAGQTSFSNQADDYARGVPVPIVVEDGTATLSWEWGLSAGNGTIQALALTHTDVGNVGTGSTSSAFRAFCPVINASTYTTGPIGGLTFTHSDNKINNMVLYVDDAGYGYRFEAGTTSVTIYKCPVVYAKTGLVASPFLDFCISSHVVNTTTNFNTYQPDYFFDENGYLYLLYNSSASHTVDVEKINLSNFTTTHYQWTNIGAGNITVGPLRSRNCAFPYEAYYENGFVYLRCGVGRNSVSGLLKVQVSNTANQTHFNTTTNIMGGCFRPSLPNKILVGKKAVINNGVIYNGVNSLPDNFYDNEAQTPMMMSKTGLANLAMQWQSGGSGQYYVAVSKFYLGTKYNLQSAVTKTPSQSMIVTYTLTEVAP